MHAYTAIRRAPFHGCPFALYSGLCGDRPDTVLLESKDGDGNNNVASLLFVENAVRITCRGPAVTAEALTPNGARALDAVAPSLASVGAVTRRGDCLTVTVDGPRPTGDDMTRIKGRYAMDVLRLFAFGWNLGTDATEQRLVLPGVFSYDHIDHFEVLPEAAQDRLHFPDFVFYLPEVTVTVDHVHAEMRVAVHGYGATNYDPVYREDTARAEALLDRAVRLEAPSALRIDLAAARSTDPSGDVDIDDTRFADLVTALKRHIVAGDVFQIVPSRTFFTPCADPLRAYDALRLLNPSPYLFFLRHPEFALFGSSPETYVRVAGTPRTVTIKPIAGTRPRGFRNGVLDKDLDGRMEAELKLNEKELAEHMMLVDLARNDVARVCVPGSRHVPRLLVAERYSHVMHLVSVVEGRLRDELDALHAYLASANMGTLVGSPKIEAASLLRRFELDKRGPYGGAVGYLTSDGEMDTAIVIRSAFVRDGRAHVRAGAGVVFDSDPAAEAAETRAKASAVLRAVAAANEVSP